MIEVNNLTQHYLSYGYQNESDVLGFYGPKAQQFTWPSPSGWVGRHLRKWWMAQTHRVWVTQSQEAFSDTLPSQ